MRLLKREIGTVKVGVLNTRYCELLQKGDELPADEISVAEAREILWIEDELRGRLYQLMIGDVLPILATVTKKDLEFIDHQKITREQIAGALGAKIKFKIVVISSIGTKVIEKNVHVDSRGEADLLANKLIRDLGFKRATYKIL